MQVLQAGRTNKNAFKALIAAEYTGVKVELFKEFEVGVSNRTTEFLKMNPIGNVHKNTHPGLRSFLRWLRLLLSPTQVSSIV